ncbi:hypothetical protein HZ326_14450 [Fusarium oxysporum f. sp. albedinis]|nr:hypothetical protein HZ326_14450 [Fusarium oxysporum f. sp. albedinis]
MLPAMLANPNNTSQIAAQSKVSNSPEEHCVVIVIPEGSFVFRIILWHEDLCNKYLPMSTKMTRILPCFAQLNFVIKSCRVATNASPLLPFSLQRASGCIGNTGNGLKISETGP